MYDHLTPDVLFETMTWTLARIRHVRAWPAGPERREELDRLFREFRGLADELRSRA